MSSSSPSATELILHGPVSSSAESERTSTLPSLSIKLDREALELRPEGHPHRSDSLGNLANSLRTYFQHRGRMEDLEEAIALYRAALELRPEGHPDRSLSLASLASSLWTCFEHRGRMEDLEEAIALHRAALELRPEGHPDRSLSLGNLASSLWTCFEHRGRMEDLEESIALHRAALELRPEGHPHRSDSLGNLANSLRTRFQHCDRMEDLEEAIALERAALDLRPEGHPLRSSSLGNLASSLSTCFEHRGRMEDFEKSIALERAALELRPEGHPLRSSSLRGLAESLYGRFQKEGSIDDLEESIESLNCAAAHKISSFSSRLACIRRVPSSASPNHQTYSVLTNISFLLAVEFLEQGRALLWSQIRGLRIPVDQLSEVNKGLAERFDGCSHRLETLIASSGSRMSGSETDGGGSRAYDTLRGRNPVEQMFVEMRRLSEDQEAIINEIRQIPGFEGFLRSTSFDVLQQAASEGPVIILNLSEYRSDALIVLSSKDEPCVCVPLDQEFYSDSVELHKEFIRTRKEFKVGSKEYDEILRRVMKVLWDRVVSKVVEKLKGNGITEGSRIWWCPTSVLIAFPFHAAGPYTDVHGKMKYLLDDYISSYTPTLTSLINARSGALVRDARASPGAVIKALRKVEWVHFVCHGILAEEPFDSSLKLPGGNLTLLDIARAHLPNAEFAFLSACHTAEQGPESALDESLRLAAVMQFCGFRSVVGTMWQLLDRDGPFLSKAVYGHLMYELEEGEMKFKAAAAAVRKAALSLREWKDEGRNGDAMTERWVNLVHIGA
ncbi:TPR-like protein [Sanghuangporus baumii]|uniref:TPR-like protein n=1 Tax=Sanghuangporus baumii TaxID=108892 RepID=A0A9Q5N7G5_SANBA|nr:TPR-like protein [Sanghuangporus baumii]